MAPEENPTPTNPNPSVMGDTPQVTPSEAQPTVTMSAPPAAPTGPVVSTHDTSVPSGFGKKRWFVPAVAGIAAVILLGGSYVFAFYLPNQPDNVYNSSLTNSGKALDKLISYTQEQSKTHYKSAAFDGTIKVKSSGSSFDATLNGAFDNNANGNLQLKADVQGQNISANLRSVKATGNSSPDLYVQVTGVKSILDLYGLGSLDNQWVSIDHTLLDTYAKQYGSMLSGGAYSTIGNKAANSNPTADQINDAIAKVQAVNKQYIFTTDSSKAVLVKQKFVGKETQNGRSVDHFVVGYNKDHLESYVGAVKTALDTSKLNDWAKKANNGKSISDAIDFNTAITNIKNAKTSSKDHFDLYVDTKTKLIGSVQVTDTTSNSTKVTFGQSYTGGSVYPLFINFTDSSSTGQLGLSVDTANNTYKLTFNFTQGSTLSADLSVNVTPSNKSVTVTAPTGATSLTDLLTKLGSGGTGATGTSLFN